MTRVVHIKNSERLTAVARMLVDQSCFAPIATGAFFFAMGLMEGNDPIEKVQTFWWTALKTNWSVWPFAQLVTFGIIPLQFRILFVNVVSIGMGPFDILLDGACLI